MVSNDPPEEGMPFRARPFLISALWHTCADDHTREVALQSIIAEDAIHRAMFNVKEWGN